MLDWSVPPLGHEKWMGATLPGWAALMLPSDSGVDVQARCCPAELVLAGWVTMTDLLLERADEARQLIGALSLA